MRDRFCSLHVFNAWPCWGRMFLVALAACSGVQGQAEYLVRSWDRETGPEVRGVSSVVQTGDGFLWLGTFGGLVRFDGEKFERIELNSLPRSQGNRISVVAPDGAGRLWLGYETGDVAVLHRDTGRVEAIPMRWPPFAVRSLAFDPRGDTWALFSDHSLVRLKDGWRAAGSSTATQSSLVRFVSAARGGLWALRDARAEEVMVEDAGPSLVALPFEEGSMRGAARASQGGLWVASTESVRRWADGAWQEERQPYPCTGVSLTCLLETQAGELVFGTRDAGVYVLGLDGTVQHCTKADGLAHDWIFDLTEDQDGNLLAGTAGGLSVLRHRRVQVVTSADNWRGERLLCVAPAIAGGWWVGTEGAGLYRVTDDGVRRFAKDEGLTKEFVWSVLEESDGQMWVGTWGEGLFTRRDGRFAPVKGWNPGAWVVTALLRSRDQTLWVGTNIGVAAWREGQWRWITEAAGVPLGFVRCLAEDAQGRIFFGTNGHGLGRVSAGRLDLVGQEAGIGEGFIQALHFSSDGTLWVGTQGRGVWRWQNERWAKIDHTQGLPSDEIGSIAEDAMGNFWFTSPLGVFSVQAKELEECLEGRREWVQPFLLDEADGMPASDCAGGAQDSALMAAGGRLLVPTAKGLASLATPEIKRRTESPRVVFTSATADDRRVPLTALRQLDVGPGVRRLEIFFSVPDFTAPMKTRVAYQLGGLDDHWIELGSRRSVMLNYLQPRSYELRLRATNGDGVMLPQPAMLKINLRPYYWETGWFRLLLGFLTAAAIVVLVGSLVRWRAQRGLRLLEQQHAVERERTRIARDIHDDLGASLCRIMLLSQRDFPDDASRGQQTERIGQINTVARTITRTMDELVWAVDPKHDTLESFAAYAVRLSQEMLVDAGLRCRLVVPPELPPVRLGAGVRHHLLMALRESIRNAVRHAHASEVSLSLICTGPELHLEVRDNGRGMVVAKAGAVPAQSAAASGGNGLSNLRARLAEIGGRVEIISAPGAGTTIRLVAPLAVSARSF